MENKAFPKHDFDPDFSEYNPILGNLKEEPVKKEENSFMNFFKKLNCRLLIQLD